MKQRPKAPVLSQREDQLLVYCRCNVSRPAVSSFALQVEQLLDHANTIR